MIDAKRGILTVHLVGPLHMLGGDVAFEDIGICMVAGFDGIVGKGRVRIEGIDLKVW